MECSQCYRGVGLAEFVAAGYANETRYQKIGPTWVEVVRKICMGCYENTARQQHEQALALQAVLNELGVCSDVVGVVCDFVATMPIISKKRRRMPLHML
jgi:hypothetical protein